MPVRFVGALLVVSLAGWLVLTIWLRRFIRHGLHDGSHFERGARELERELLEEARESR